MLLLNLTGLQQVVEFSFILTFFGMIAATVFFFIETRSVPATFQRSMVLSVLICMIAAMNYAYMKDIYIAGLSTNSPKFPTVFRYIDWILTVPLMLIKFPAMLGIGRRAIQFIFILTLLSLLMIVSGFVGEINIPNTTLHFGAFGVSCAAWFMIIALLWFSLGELPDEVNEIKRVAIQRMTLFVFLGWSIYPIGYLLPSVPGIPSEVRELIYNLGDLFNKIGLALVVYQAGCRQRVLDQEAIAHPAAS